MKHDRRRSASRRSAAGRAVQRAPDRLLTEQETPAPTAAAPAAAPEPLSIVAPFYAVRERAVTYSPTPLPSPPSVRRPAKVAHLLAFAHHVQRTLDRGGYDDYATLARELGLSRARVSQVMDLLLIAPDLQEQLLMLEAIDGREPLGDRALRSLPMEPTWRAQREHWRKQICPVLEASVPTER